LFIGLNIPLSYLIYLIALDELGHFSPVVRHAAIRANEQFLWEKFLEKNSDYLTTQPVAANILQDASIRKLFMQ